MYIPGSYMCLSFHHKKPLKIGKGGMILTDDEKAIETIKMKSEGRGIGVPYQDDETEDGELEYAHDSRASSQRTDSFNGLSEMTWKTKLKILPTETCELLIYLNNESPRNSYSDKHYK